MELTKQILHERSKKLEEARKFLKTQFVGIDDVIDKFINSVKVWYVTPELMTRPLIVNLWGITGTGKTDLVRKFVNYIDFTDRFCEIQMDSKEGNATVEDYLENTLESKTNGILLLDEIQRFRSVNEEGKEGNSTKYQDLWMLLSDGVLQSNSKIKQELMRLMVEEDYWEERSTPVADNPEEQKKLEDKRKSLKYKMYHYEARTLKKLLRLPEDVGTIMTYSKEYKSQLIKSKINSKEIYEGKKYNNLLIIISGNLDEAFKVAGNVDDADLDADVYHEYSKTIDIVKIKKALKNRFKPEQIARFGNIHIIYPILNKKYNYEIIKKKIEDITINIKTNHNIEIEFDNSVFDVVYSNGVFPVQGIRPLLSTISAIVENSIPVFLYEYLKRGSKDKIVIHHESGKLTSTIKGKKISYEIPRVLDDIRKNVSTNKLSLVAVHEAGHAIAYAILNKTVPTQIVASTTSPSAGGFVGTHGSLGSKKDLINDVIVSFAGRAAEEIVFGEKFITQGASSDYVHATTTLQSMVRTYGMSDYLGVYFVPANNKSMLDSNANVDAKIEELARELYAKTVELVRQNLDFLLAVSEELIKNKKIEQEDFVRISKAFIGKISVINSGDDLEMDFNKMFKDAISKRKRQKSIKWKKENGSPKDSLLLLTNKYE